MILRTVSIGRNAFGSSGTKAAPPALSRLPRISFSTAARSSTFDFVAPCLENRFEEFSDGGLVVVKMRACS